MRLPGRDLTQVMASSATGFLSSLGDVDGFLLKSASPSCSVGDAKVYEDCGKVVGRIDGLLPLVDRVSQTQSSQPRPPKIW